MSVVRPNAKEKRESKECSNWSIVNWPLSHLTSLDASVLIRKTPASSLFIQKLLFRTFGDEERLHTKVLASTMFGIGCLR